MNSSCGEEKGDEDRMSSLPDSILHVIFSTIDMKQVVQTSLLSTRWKNFWKSTPTLCFDAKKNDIKKAMNFVERVLLLRNNSSNIHKLHLSFTDSDRNEIDSDPYRILTWLNFAFIRGVKEVYLENCFSSLSDSPTELPPQMFTTLEVFKLKSRGSVRLPTSVFSSPHLRILKLEALTLYLSEGDSNGELVLSCPALEDLVLKRCFIKNVSILNISAHQLKSLDIQNRDRSCEIKISTPNLTSLYLWSDSYDSYQYYSLKHLSSLVSCRIGREEGSDGCRCLFCIPSLMKILNAVTNVSTLQIYGYSCRKDTLPSEGVHDKLLNPFPNLTLLRIELSTGFSILAVNLLRCSPSIKTLIWDAGEMDGCSMELKYWEELLSFQYTFHGLKYIKAQNLYGTNGELKILKFLLKNAKALKSVKIALVEWIKMDEKLKVFMKKLHNLPKTSPRVEISFFLNFED